MNAYFRPSDLELWHVAGWTMLHFVWLSALVMLAAAVCRLLLRRATADVRYSAAIVSLAILAVLPIGIAAWLVGQSPLVAVVERIGQVEQLSQTAIGVPPRLATTEPVVELAGSDVERTSPGATGSASVPSAIDISTGIASGTHALAGALEPVVPYLPWLWLVGTPITFALLATGLIGTRRLRVASRAVVDGPVAEACARLARAMCVRGRVAVAVCERIATPVLVGIVRPIILLPPSALVGWSPDELEMVLLHELAHVRRWDNLVNLVQRIVESALFFHPAVWWASSWVRREREACCDAVVVNHTQRPHAYAEMLIEFASRLNAQSEPGRPRPRLSAVLTSAMAAGPLRSRICRILQLEDDPMLVSGKSLALVMSGLVLTATLAVLYVPSLSQAGQSTTEATESTEAKPTEPKPLDWPANLEVQLQTQNNLTVLILSLQVYVDSKGSFPAHAICDAQGKPLLSWRVQILPFMGEKALYEQFRLDEPWDSPHNRQLIEHMPKLFQNPSVDTPGKTNYLAVVGKDCVFDGSPTGISLRQFTKSTSNSTSRTIVLVEADADRAVEWTKPADIEYDPQNPRAGLGSLRGRFWYAAWAAGKVSPVPNDTGDEQLRAFFSRVKEDYAVDVRSPVNAVSDAARSLAEAVKEFNEVAKQDTIGKDQPPLTVEEVVAAIEGWKFMRERIPVADDVFEQYQRIARTGMLPTGARLSYTTAWVVENGRFDVWWIDLTIRTSPKEKGIYPTGYTFRIRNTNTRFLPLIPEEDQISIAVPNQQEVNPQAASRPTAHSSAANGAPAQMMQEATSVDKSSLRYDGKTFDQWRDEWRNELSTERRTEAVKALAAFGAHGYGKKAAEAILDVVGQYDIWMVIGDNPGILPLQNACITAFGAPPPNGEGEGVVVQPLPKQDSLPVVLNAARSEKRQVRLFLIWVLGAYNDPQALEALQKLSKDNDRDVRVSAINALPPLNADHPNMKLVERIREGLRDDTTGAKPFMQKLTPEWYGGHGPQSSVQLYYVPELYAKLFSQDESVRRLARHLIHYIRSADAPPVVEQLVQVLSSDASTEKQVEAIRALAAMGPQAHDALPAIERLLPEPVNSDDPRVVPAAVARELIWGDAPGGSAMTALSLLKYQGDAEKAISEEKERVLSRHLLGVGGGVF